MQSANVSVERAGQRVPLAALGSSQLDHFLLQAVAQALDVRPASESSGLCDWQLKRVRRHVEQNIGGPILVRELAAIAKLSQSHFSRSFGISTGLSPHTFIVHARVDHARTLMRETSANLAEIAFQCGLADQSHLSRVFRRVVGQSPSKWRRDAVLMRS